MARITFAGNDYDLAPDQTVLQALEKADLNLPFSCRTGVCLTCILRCRTGELPPQSQLGLRPGQIEQGFFLPCVCRPGGDLLVEAPSDAELYGRATVSEVHPLSETICRVRLYTAKQMFYHAGQFVNLRRADGLARSYSLASVPHLDDALEIHVKRLPNGRMSNWIHEDLTVGEALDIHGPNGDCFYVGGRPERPLLLIGNGSGLAPLYGIIRDALTDGHTGPIYLYHGSRTAKGLYYTEEVRALCAVHDNLRFIPCLSGETAEGRAAVGAQEGRAEVVALAAHTNLQGWGVYLCGYPPMVQTARKMAFLAGAALPDILSDPFELRDLRRVPRAPSTAEDE